MYTHPPPPSPHADLGTHPQPHTDEVRGRADTSVNCEADEKTSALAQKALYSPPANYNKMPSLQHRVSSHYCRCFKTTLGKLMDEVDKSAINVLMGVTKSQKNLKKSVERLTKALAKNPEHLANTDLLSAASKDENIMKAVKSTLLKNPEHLANANLLSAASEDINIMKVVQSAALENPEAMKALLDSPFFKESSDGETDEKFASRCTQIQKFIDLTYLTGPHVLSEVSKDLFPIALLANLEVPTQALGDDITERELTYINKYAMKNLSKSDRQTIGESHRQLCKQSRNYPHLKPLIAKATALMVSDKDIATKYKKDAIANCLENGIVPKAAILTFNKTYSEKTETIEQYLVRPVAVDDKENDKFVYNNEAKKEIEHLIHTINQSKIIAEGVYGAAHEVQISTEKKVVKVDKKLAPTHQIAVRKLFTNVTKITKQHHINQNHAELNILQALQPKQGGNHEQSYFPKLLGASVVTTWNEPHGEEVPVSSEVGAKVDEVANKKFDKVKCRTWSKTIDASALVSSEVEAKVDEVANKKFGKEDSDEKTKFMSVLTPALVDLQREGKNLNDIETSNILELKDDDLYKIQIDEIDESEVVSGNESTASAEKDQFKRVLTGALTDMKERGINIKTIKDSNILTHKRNGRWEVQILRSTDLKVKLTQKERVNSVTMQKCPGVPLGQFKAKNYNQNQIHALASELNKAIDTMLDRGIVHNDLHWNNILVHTTESGNWQVTIIDFGFANQIKSKNELMGLKQEDKTRLLNCLVFNDPLRAKLQKLGWGSTHVELSRTQYTPNCPHASEDRTH